MKKQTHERNGAVIKDLTNGKAEKFDSVNKAKKAAGKLTKSNGLGTLLVKK